MSLNNLFTYFQLSPLYSRWLDFAAPWNVPPLAIARVASGLLRRCLPARQREIIDETVKVSHICD